MKNKNNNHFKPIISIRISRFLLTKIDELAKEKKKTRSSLINDMIKSYTDR
ncbi:ribbon-helix-helix protein, CopG family [uncultured Cetobacterium sp.]|uniref:ribbon-helix-helix protein, CopG family n=1 Tax=uncultured Cetobacterium sp. TaxID=527638 RepID=UPI003420BDA0